MSRYHAILTNRSQGDDHGCRPRRGEHEIVDTVAIQTSGGVIYAFLCRTIETTNAEHAIMDGPDVLMDIDAGRIDTDTWDAEAMERCNTSESGRMYDSNSQVGTFDRASGSGTLNTSQGRWPSNTIFVHDGACQYQGTTSVEGITGGSIRQKQNDVYGSYDEDYVDTEGNPGYADEDGLEEADDWHCTETCPVQQLKDQSGVCETGNIRRNIYAKSSERFCMKGDFQGYRNDSYQGDRGTAARYFYQAPSVEDVVSYLYHLVGEIKWYV